MVEASNEDTKIHFHQLLATFSDSVYKESAPIKTKTKIDDELSNLIINENVQPLEKYLGISCETRLKIFFETLQIQNVVRGRIISIFGDDISVLLLSIIDGRKRWIQDLKIMATVDLSNENIPTRASIDELEVGDTVKGIVFDINRESKELWICFNEKLLDIDQMKYFPLGKIDNDEDDGQGSDSDDQIMDRWSLLDDIKSSSTYTNPNSLHNLIKYFSIDDINNRFLLKRPLPMFNESVEDLRERQSYKWSMEMVGIGVKHFREQELKEAMKHFDQAITFYPKNVEAYVARGALKANRSDLKQAVEDFKKALKIKPKHRNGIKYLIETMSSIAKRYEKELKWKEASKCYKEIIDMDFDTPKEIKERYQQIKQIISSKIITGGSVNQNQSSSASAKDVTSERNLLKKKLNDSSKERITKLRKLLEIETNNLKQSSSSSSSSSLSSSSSSSDSDSLTDDDWVEKSTSATNQKSNQEKRSLAKKDRRFEKGSELFRERAADEQESPPKRRRSNSMQGTSRKSHTEKQTSEPRRKSKREIPEVQKHASVKTWKSPKRRGNCPPDEIQATLREIRYSSKDLYVESKCGD